MDSNYINELRRLKFEEFLWILFIFISCLNLYGSKVVEKYVYTNQPSYERESNRIFQFTLEITFLIYIYFFIRNYAAYQKASLSQKKLYQIKLFGSSFLLAGVLLLFYFQTHQQSFLGSPAV